MSQQQSPWLEGAYGWNFGESGWNSGMDTNLLKFSFLFDRNVDSITGSLPAAVNGQAHYLTTDNRLYFAVGTTYFSTIVPKWFTVVVRGTGATWQYNGTVLVEIESIPDMDSRLSAVELTISSLGTAAFEDISAFATTAELDVVEGQAQTYTDALRQDLSDIVTPSKGAGQVGRSAQIVESIADLRLLDKTAASKDAIVSGYYSQGDAGGGIYYLDAADVSSVDDGGSTIVAVDGGRWKSTDPIPSSRQFGAKGDNVTDDSAAFANQTTKALSTGGVLKVDKGLFKVAGQSLTVGAINIDHSTIAAEPVTSTLRVDVVGEGQAQSVLMNTVDATYAMSAIGAPGVASHFHTKVDGIGFGGGPLKHGLRAYNAAYMQFKDLGFWGLDTCLRLESVLSSDLENLTFSDSKIGVSAAKGTGFSGINAISIRKSVFRACSTFGVAAPGPCVNISISGGSTEGCGTHADLGTGGMSFTFDGAEGGVGLIVENHYFENNGGAADISLFNSGGANVVHYFKGCNFNRVSSTNFVTNNVHVTGGPQRLIFDGCSFNGYGTYVEDAARLYVNSIPGTHTIVCINCTFGSSLGQGTLRNVNASVPYNGNITAAGTANFLPTGWSISHPSAGVYTITHNLNVPTTQQSLTATSVASTALVVQRVVLTSANAFTVVTTNTAGTLTDSAFTFQFTTT